MIRTRLRGTISLTVQEKQLIVQLYYGTLGATVAIVGNYSCFYIVPQTASGLFAAKGSLPPNSCKQNRHPPSRKVLP